MIDMSALVRESMLYEELRAYFLAAAYVEAQAPSVSAKSTWQEKVSTRARLPIRCIFLDPRSLCYRPLRAADYDDIVAGHSKL